MRHDGEAGGVRLVDDRGELCDGELGAQLVGARRREPTRGHHLDHVDAALGVLRDRRAYIAVHDSAEEVAMPARGGERRPRGDDARQAGAIPEHERTEAAVAEIADRRHPGHHMSMQRVLDDRVDRLIGHRSGPLQPSVGGVRDEMGVAVDQPGQNRAGVLGHLHAIRHLDPARLHTDDSVPVEQHRRTARKEPGAVEGMGRADRPDEATVPRRAERGANCVSELIDTPPSRGRER